MRFRSRARKSPEAQQTIQASANYWAHGTESLLLERSCPCARWYFWRTAAKPVCDVSDTKPTSLIHHSITSSARASSEVGTLRPSVLAVFKLMTSSNFVGRSIGSSAGLAPFSTLSTKAAHR
jgi:hypothetical protein